MKRLILLAFGLMLGFGLTQSAHAGIVKLVSPPIVNHAAHVSVKVLSYPAKPAKAVVKAAWRVIW
ncbi:MAG TPA: hypothetical protein VKX49_12805 [Bryobacteraceae bacterium]|nr:hypothetical protein [Bryobacteraceae bacterium]